MEKKTINIGLGIINYCLKNIDDLKALTLAIVLKAMFKSSVVTNFSIRKIINITGFNYNLAKLSIERGMKRRFFKIIDCPDGTKILKINRLWHETRSKAISFQVIKFEDGHVNLYFKDGKDKNEKIFANEKKVKQTPQDYIYKVMQAAIYKVLNNRSSLLDLTISEYYTKHGMKNAKLHMDDAGKVLKMKREINKSFDIEDDNKKIYTGISYETLLSYFFTPYNGLNRYKIQKIVKMCEKEGLIKIVHNYVMVDDEMDPCDCSGPKNKKAQENVYKPNLKQDGIAAIFMYGEHTYTATRNRVASAYYITDECGEVIRNLHQSGYRGKSKHKNCLFMQLGNDYIATSDIIKRRRRTQKERTYLRKHYGKFNKSRAAQMKCAKEALKNLYTL